MADQKVSELAAASTAGSNDLLYLVQGGTSKKITISHLVSSVSVLLTLPIATTSVLGLVKADGTSITIINGVISAVGGAVDLGNLKISGSGIGTQGAEGGWGDYDLYLDPGGESSAGIYIPRPSQQINGGILSIYSNATSSGGIQLLTPNSTWDFKANGIVGLPSNTLNAGTQSLDMKSSSYVEMWYQGEDGEGAAWRANPSYNQTSFVWTAFDGTYIQHIRGENNSDPTWSHGWGWLNDGSMQFPSLASSARTGTGEVLLFTKTNNQKIIGTKNGNADQPTVERLVISGGDGWGTGEGGDIYLWAGRSAYDTNGGGNGGGDIKIDAGDGYDVSGGTVKIRGGNSQIGSETIAGQGGWIEIDGGSTWNGGNAGDITLTAGRAWNGGNDGKVAIRTVNGTYQWDFQTDGVLKFPNGTAAMNKQRYGMGDLVAYLDGHWVLGEHNGDDFGTIGMRIAPGIEGAVELVLPSNNGATSNAVQLNNYVGDVSIQADTKTWKFHTSGTVKANSSFSIETASGAGIPVGLTKITANQGWGDGTVGTNLATTGGYGQGLTVDVSDSGSGYGSIVINTPGTGYKDGDQITVTSADQSVSDTFVISIPGNVWTFGDDGKTTLPNDTLASTSSLSIKTTADVPTGVANWNGGGGWNLGSYLDLATTGGHGSGLTVDVAANGGGYINISAITINNPGTGYLDGDVITITNENDIGGTFNLIFTDNTWEFRNDGGLEYPDASVQTGAAISLADLKTLVAASTSFEDFQIRIAAL